MQLTKYRKREMALFGFYSLSYAVGPGFLSDARERVHERSNSAYEQQEHVGVST